ncbi:MAG TPA: AAA family ATPase [Solirubrobacteraceae bacterium]|jgi:predicted  nucleic acid-binding Zn-ribbon protein|nr:AAA family ATPase [Solirubrobacteraceae bacterium]
MGSELRLRSVRLDPPDAHHSWEFPNGVTVIVGASGGGKTQLLNLIRSGLGLDVPLVKEVRQAAAAVTLDVEIHGAPMQLTRRFSQTTVDVSEGDEPVRTFSLSPNHKTLPLLGDWLLQRLGIPVVRVGASRKRKSNRTTRISFEDVFAYCDLEQDEMDRSTVYDRDAFRNIKRASTFELLYGIIDAQIADLEAERLQLQADVEGRTTRVEEVRSFVDDKNLAESMAAIDIRLAHITEEQTALEAQLQRAREDAEKAAASVAGLPGQIAAAERFLASAEAELGDVMQELAGVGRAANQLDRDLQVVREGADAQSILDAMPFVTCPRCDQPLNRRTPGHCVVCLQADPPPDPEQLGGLTAQLAAQLAETRALESRLAAVRDVVSDQAGRLRGELNAKRAELRRAIQVAVEPHTETAQRIIERLGSLRGEQNVLIQARPVAAAVEQESAEIATLGPRIDELHEREDQLREQRAPMRERVEELSDEFDTILHRFTLPWLGKAEVDRTTYLPRVNGVSLKALSSGGMKTTTNVAYYLANLVTALRDREILAPSFLMLDSIRKDSGSEGRDLVRAEHIYTYLRTLQDSRNNPGALAADFQLIVVDNDLPKEFESAFNVLRIDPDHPLIRLADQR